ncbi:hypothetical protein TTRE_0000158801 [Trichuris trichiura]|uniref:Uncharacterized protein n=1 Tax=Trichuris trichiura TaxID=36087 RepID=A0A077Z019_TRITR|nr:hypothetical protein TTRE_0000158801 [Trichuris trichiura]
MSGLSFPRRRKLQYANGINNSSVVSHRSQPLSLYAVSEF